MVLFLRTLSIRLLILIIKSGLELLFPDCSAQIELSESVRITTLSGWLSLIHFNASMIAVSSALNIETLPFSLKDLVRWYSGIA